MANQMIFVSDLYQERNRCYNAKKGFYYSDVYHAYFHLSIMQ